MCESAVSQYLGRTARRRRRTTMPRHYDTALDLWPETAALSPTPEPTRPRIPRRPPRDARAASFFDDVRHRRDSMGAACRRGRRPGQATLAGLSLADAQQNEFVIVAALADLHEVDAAAVAAFSAMTRRRFRGAVSRTIAYTARPRWPSTRPCLIRLSDAAAASGVAGTPFPTWRRWVRFVAGHGKVTGASATRLRPLGRGVLPARPSPLAPPCLFVVLLAPLVVLSVLRLPAPDPRGSCSPSGLQPGIPQASKMVSASLTAAPQAAEVRSI